MYIKNPDIIETRYSDDIVSVVYNFTVYSFEETGLYIWDRINLLSSNDIAIEISNEYGVELKQAEDDVDEFIHDLIDAQLIFLAELVGDESQCE